MALALPQAFPMVLSLDEASVFLTHFMPEPETGSLRFPTLENTQAFLNRETGDELRLSALAVSHDAWRIFHRLVIESPSMRDVIYDKIQQDTDINHTLPATRGAWKIRKYRSSFVAIDALKGGRFTDGE